MVSGMITKEKMSVHEALELGLCEYCVSYGEVIAPPFTTHCRSTLGRTGGDAGLCTKKVWLRAPKGCRVIANSY